MRLVLHERHGKRRRLFFHLEHLAGAEISRDTEVWRAVLVAEEVAAAAAAPVQPWLGSSVLRTAASSAEESFAAVVAAFSLAGFGMASAATLECNNTHAPRAR